MYETSQEGCIEDKPVRGGIFLNFQEKHHVIEGSLKWGRECYPIHTILSSIYFKRIRKEAEEERVRGEVRREEKKGGVVEGWRGHLPGEGINSVSQAVGTSDEES